MANENNSQQVKNSAAGGKPVSGWIKTIILIVVVLLVLAVSIGGTLFALGVFDRSAAGFRGKAAGQPIDKPRPAMYFSIEPAFVVNFPSQGRQRYLQLEITVLTREPDVFNAMQTHISLIKNRLVMLLGDESYQRLQTDAGKVLLRQKALAALQQLMQQEIGKSGIEDVLFTNFVMQ